MIHRQPDRYCHPFQVHANQGAANIQSRISANLLHCHRVLHGCINCRGKRAAGVNLRHCVDNLIALTAGNFPLYNQSSIQVLTALRRQRNSLFLQNRIDSLQHCLGDLQTAAFSNVDTGNFTGAASNHQQLSFFQTGCLNKLMDNMLRLLCQCFIHVSVPSTKSGFYLNYNTKS